MTANINGTARVLVIVHRVNEMANYHQCNNTPVNRRHVLRCRTFTSITVTVIYTHTHAHILYTHAYSTHLYTHTYTTALRLTYNMTTTMISIPYAQCFDAVGLAAGRASGV